MIIYMIMDKLTMNWFWYPNQWGLFIGTLIPNQCGLFIGILIPNQWGLFIGILIYKPVGIIYWYFDTQPIGVIHWYSDTQPMGVIHWYSDAQSRENNVTIVIRLLRIWITFEYLNYFESLKLHMLFWKCTSIWTILSQLKLLMYLFGMYCKL